MKKAKTDRISTSLQTYPTILSNARSKQMGEEIYAQPCKMVKCTLLLNTITGKILMLNRRIPSFYLPLRVIFLRTAPYPPSDALFSTSTLLARSPCCSENEKQLFRL